MWNRNNRSSMEKNQQRLDAGIMSTHYPEVSSIVIRMMYKQKGLAKPILRTLNLYPESCAFFKIDCLSNDCVDGGFDLTQVINSMIRNHRREVKGELGCDDSGPRSDHATIAYAVAIQYI